MALTTSEERKALILKIGLGLVIAGMLAGYTYVWIQWVYLEAAVEAAVIHHNHFRSRHGSAPLKRNIDLDMLALMCAEYYRPRRGVDHTCPYIKQGYNYYFKEGVLDNGFKVGPFDYSNRWSHMKVAIAGSYSFYSELENYNFSDFKTSLNASSGRVAGHFTEMVWRGVEEFGFASAVYEYPNGGEYGSLGVFLYHPGGNMITEDKAYFIMNVRPVLEGTPPLEPQKD